MRAPNSRQLELKRITDGGRDDLLDACERAFRILRSCTKIQLSPGEWDTMDDAPLIEQPENGPLWEGDPGTHPILPFLIGAIRRAKAS